MGDFGYRYLVATRFFRSVALVYANVAMPLYLVALNIKIEYIGLVILGVIIFNMTVSFISGMLGDRIGYKYSLLTVEILALIGITILALATNIYFIIIGIILGGITGGGGAIRGSMSAGLTAFIANNWENEKERSRRLAQMVILGGIGSVFGSALLYFNMPLSEIFGNAGAYRAIFAFAALMLLLSAAMLTLIEDSKRPKKTTKVMKIGSLRYSLRVISANLTTGMGIGISVPLLPLWFALTYHLNTTSLSYIFVSYYAVTAIGAYFASRLIHRFNLVNVASVSRLVNGAALVAMALSPFAIMAAVLYEVYGFAAAFGASSRSTVNVRGIHKEDYGAASTMQGVAMNTSQLTSGLSGYALEYALPLPLIIGGLLQFSGGIIYKKFMKNSTAAVD